MRTRMELIAENCKLNMDITTKILKIQSLEIAVELLKRENEQLKTENIVIKLKNEKLTSKQKEIE